jgi:hypothetical protein
MGESNGLSNRCHHGYLQKKVVLSEHGAVLLMDELMGDGKWRLEKESSS